MNPLDCLSWQLRHSHHDIKLADNILQTTEMPRFACVIGYMYLTNHIDKVQDILHSQNMFNNRSETEQVKSFAHQTMQIKGLGLKNTGITV